MSINCIRQSCRIEGRIPPRRALLAALALILAAGPAPAQDNGTLDPKPLPPLANPDDPNNPAKELFGRKTEPAKMAPRSIGFYAKGCLAGGMALPINGKTWQVMRLSRNRNWGHPTMVQFLERLSPREAPRSAGRVSWSATCRSRAAGR